MLGSYAIFPRFTFKKNIKFDFGYNICRVHTYIEFVFIHFMVLCRELVYVLFVEFAVDVTGVFI